MANTVRPGTTFKLGEDLRVESASRSFDKFQDGSAHSAMHAKHLAKFERPSIDGAKVQGPLTKETYMAMSEQVRQHRVSHDRNFGAGGTNTVMITDLPQVPVQQSVPGDGMSARSAGKRLDVGSGRGVVATSTGSATSLETDKSRLRVLKSNMHLESTVK